MPLYKTITPNSDTKILIWNIDEEYEELFRDIFLNDYSMRRVEKMKSGLHQKAFLSVRHLLKFAGYTDLDLFYTDDGKPHLRDGKQISITHSHYFSAIIISNTQVGIDIELNREKIKRIASKFVGKENEFLTEKGLVQQLTVLWGAKESLYKIHPDSGLQFKHHLPIEPFKLSDKKTIGWIKKDNYFEKYKIFFEQIKDYTLVYAMN